MLYVATVNGKKYEVNVERVQANNQSAQSFTPTQPVQNATDGTPVVCPLAGTILEILVSEGQAVKKGQTLLVLEALKMENEISSPCDGVVKLIPITSGSRVETDSVLMIIS